MAKRDSTAPKNSVDTHGDMGDLLFPDGHEAATPIAPDLTKLNTIQLVGLKYLVSNEFNPRDIASMSTAEFARLKQDILENGIDNPLRGYIQNDGKVHLIAGERRLLAARDLHLVNVPVKIIDTKGLSPVDIHCRAFLDNDLSDPLKPIEKARFIKLMKDSFGLTNNAIREKLRLGAETLNNLLSFLELPDSIQQLINTGELNATQGAALCSFKATEESKPGATPAIVKERLEDLAVKILVGKVDAQTIEIQSKSPEVVNDTSSDSDPRPVRVIPRQMQKITVKSHGITASIDFPSGTHISKLLEAIDQLREKTDRH